MTTRTEADVEDAALNWLEGLGWLRAQGPDIASHKLGVEREDNAQVVLEQRLRDAFARLNTDLSTTALDDAFRRLTRADSATLEAHTCTFHSMLRATPT